jgi:hypothetical protein
MCVSEKVVPLHRVETNCPGVHPPQERHTAVLLSGRFSRRHREATYELGEGHEVVQGVHAKLSLVSMRSVPLHTTSFRMYTSSAGQWSMHGAQPMSGVNPRPSHSRVMYSPGKRRLMSPGLHDVKHAAHVVSTPRSLSVDRHASPVRYFPLPHVAAPSFSTVTRSGAN